MANVKGAIKLLNGMVKTADNVVSSSATTKGAVKLLNGAARQADEVIESGVRSSKNQLIKAGGNYLETNKSTAQRTAQNMSTTVRRGADAADDVINARTTMNSSVPEVSGVPVQSRRRTRRINGDVSDVPSTVDDGVYIYGEGSSSGRINFGDSEVIDVDYVEVGPNQRVERRSNRRGNNTQQPETPKVIYAGQGDNPNVIYADGPTATGGNGGSGNNGGGSSTSSSSSAGGGNSGNNGGGRSKGNRMKGNTRTHSDRINEFGNQAKDFFFGGTIDSYNNYQSGMGIMESIAKAHQNEDGSVNMMKAAGTFMTASAAARVASGGGLYKDRYGNPNLIGVPFI